ncbi:MAG: dockerin type I domain-containing protein [Pirellulaceae bacterium]|nr:dockerin type I domain-containing protein [Pirellulaceae bacterium]
MAAWWHRLRVLPARRRREPRTFRRVLRFGGEQLESRQLLAVVDLMTAGVALLPSATMRENGTDVAGFAFNKGVASVSEHGTADTFTVVLTAQPEFDVVLTLTSADVGEVTVNPAALTFTPADWATPQTVTVTGGDDDADDGTQYTHVTVSVDRECSDPGFAAVDDRHVIVTTEDDDAAGLLLNKTSADVSENETTGTFTVRLAARPDTNVVLTMISLDPSEATVSPTVLIISPAEWDVPQTVTVTGVDDPLIDGSQSTQVLVNVVDEVSDEKFRTMFRAVHVTTADNDAAALVLSKAAVTVSEAGSTATFTVVLTAKPDVSVTLTAIRSDADEATVSPAVWTVAPEDWDVPQTVTVTGVDDPRIDGDQTTWVTVSVAPSISDSQFIAAEPQAVSVTTTDDDVAGFTLSKSIAIVSETGTTDSFSIVLTAQPESNVTLAVNSSDTGEATASPATLVFTPGGWNLPQTVTITGADDSLRDGDQASLVTVAVEAGQSDDHFGDVLAQTVSVTTTDDDQGWQNPDNPFDVSGNGSVDATDVLLLVNHVNQTSGSPTLPSSPLSPPPYYDVNNDGRCTAFDVLLVINFINNQNGVGVSASSAGEGEGESNETPHSNPAPLNSASEPSGIPSGDVQWVPALQDRPASNPDGLSSAIFSTRGHVSSDPAGPAATTRVVLEPVPVAPTAALDPIDWAVPSRAAEVADDQWIPAVDASLGDWEPGWENPLEPPFAA